MSKKTIEQDELRAEYDKSDFERLERGKFYKHVIENSNVVLLNDEVADVFPNSESVNEALKSLIRVAESSTKASKE